MFDIGIGELVVILVAVLILFGPKRLPELGKALGSSLKAFKEGLKAVSEDADKPKPDDG